MSKDARPPIPPDIKRIVRKRCGYGCIFCGSPIYQIDHIVDWAVVRKHEADNLTLLCGEHHDQKTYKHMISKVALLHANDNPYALSHPDSLRSKWYFGVEQPSFELATNIFMYPIGEGSFFAPFLIEGYIPLSFTIENGQLLLDFVAHNLHGNEVLKIEKNEMILMPQGFDVEIIGTHLIISDDQRRKLLDMIIDVEIGKVKVSRLRIIQGTNVIEALSDNLLMNGKGFKDFIFSGSIFEAQIGININTPNIKAAIYISIN